MNLRTPFVHSPTMRNSGSPAKTTATEWQPIPDPEGQYSSGIADFDRLLGGGFKQGSMALFGLDATVGLDDLDLLLFPTFLNFLYHSRGILSILPSRDSPHEFRSRLTRYVTRRRFDTRVRICDYVGEDEKAPYVVDIKTEYGEKPDPRRRKQAVARVEEAEKAVRGNRGKTFLEFCAFEVFDTLLGGEKATEAFFYGVKRARQRKNLVIGLLGPGLACAAGVRRMADTEFELRRDDVGLIVRGIRPSFPGLVVTEDAAGRAPHVAFVPRPN